MDINEIAQGLVSLCSRGQFEEAMTHYYADDIVSVEAEGEQPESQGLAAVQAKGQWWVDNYEIHGMEITGPYVNGDQFAVGFKFEVTPKATGERTVLDEIGVYTVKGGKIVHERFFYRVG